MSLTLSDSGLLKTQAYIDGAWSDAASGETFDVTNPATGDVVATCASCGTEDTNRAIAAADKALVEAIFASGST